MKVHNIVSVIRDNSQKQFFIQRVEEHLTSLHREETGCSFPWKIWLIHFTFGGRKCCGYGWQRGGCRLILYWSTSVALRLVANNIQEVARVFCLIFIATHVQQYHGNETRLIDESNLPNLKKNIGRWFNWLFSTKLGFGYSFTSNLVWVADNSSRCVAAWDFIHFTLPIVESLQRIILLWVLGMCLHDDKSIWLSKT